MLDILEAIEGHNRLTQRHLAQQMGIALGLANSYLKRCVNKDLVRILHAPANRYIYHLTPHGCAEKRRLTAQHLTRSFEFYRKAGRSLASQLEICAANGWQRLLLGGISELAEIASIRAVEQGLVVIGTFEPAATSSRFLGRPVFKMLHATRDIAFDACLLTAWKDPERLYADLIGQLDQQRVLIPRILGYQHHDMEQRLKLPQGERSTEDIGSRLYFRG